MSLEAICEHCKVAVTIETTNQSKMIPCRHCGKKFLLTRSNIISKLNVFAKKKFTKAAEADLKHRIAFIRHGNDSYQAAILNAITTNHVKLTTKVRLSPAAKITFLIKDKKFIVSVRSCQLVLNIHSDGEHQYAVLADLVTMTQGTKKKVIKRSPHYLVK